MKRAAKLRTKEIMTCVSKQEVVRSSVAEYSWNIVHIFKICDAKFLCEPKFPSKFHALRYLLAS